MKKEAIIFGIISLFLLAFVYASPLAEFISPTPDNSTSTTNTSIEINTSIIEANLDQVIYNWNGTNYTVFNNSLVLMMNFDNRSALGENDTHVFDISGNGNNGTGKNFDGNEVVNGKYNKAFDFDGSNDYVNISSISFGQAFTVSAWIKPTAWGSSGDSYIHNLFCNENGAGSTFCFRIGSKGQYALRQKLAAAIYQTNNANDLESNSDLSLDVWQHVTASWDGSNIRFYINGALDRTQSASYTMDSGTHDFMVGHSPEQNRPYQGQIDELRVWNISLSATEVYQQYISNLNKFNSTQWYLYINQSKNATEGLDDGTYTYQTFTINNSSDTNSTGIRTIIVDTTSPTWENNKTNLTTSTTVGNSVYFNITFNDTNPDTYIFSWYNGTTWVNDSAPSYTDGEEISITKTLNLNEGTYNWTWYFNDTNGNDNQTDTWSITIQDSIVPNITIDSPTETEYTSSTVNLQVSADEAIDTWWYSLNNGTNTTFTPNTTLTSLTTGSYNLTIYANDSSNNLGNSSVSFNVSITATASCGDGTCNGDETCSTCSADCGSCGGGGSGSYIKELNRNLDNLKFKTHLSPGKTKIIKIKSDKETDLKELEIKAKNWITGEIEIIPYTEVPDFCSINYEEDYIFYKALDINSTFNSSLINESRLRMNVLKDWIYENNISTVKAVKCNPHYKELKIDFVNETNESGVYDIYSNGFSTLAILGTTSLDELSKEGLEGDYLGRDTKIYCFWKIFLGVVLILIIIGIIILLIKHRIYIKEKIHTRFFDFEFKFRIGKNEQAGEKD